MSMMTMMMMMIVGILFCVYGDAAAGRYGDYYDQDRHLWQIVPPRVTRAFSIKR